MTYKDLIKKVLRESVNAKDLIEKGEVITRMYNDLEKVNR